MTFNELVELVRDKGCVVLLNKTVRDACGFDKLFDSVCSKIRSELNAEGVALGSPLINDQESRVFLFDNREDSSIRKLLDLADRVRSGEERAWYSESAEHLCRAARAAFPD